MSRLANFTYSLSSADMLESTKNTKSRRAMKLLEIIMEELDRSDFTFEEIKEEFNATADARADKANGIKVIRYGLSDLRFLEKQGYIAEHPDNIGHFYILRTGDPSTGASDEESRNDDRVEDEETF